MLFFIRSIFPQVFFNLFVVYRISKSRDLPKVWKSFFTVIYVAETLMYFVGLFAVHRLPVEVMGYIQKISGIWVVFQAYLILSILSFDILIYFYRKKVRRIIRESRSKEKKTLYYLYLLSTISYLKPVCFIVLQLLVSVQLYMSYHNFMNPVVRNYDYTFSCCESPDKQTYKLLVASDLHLGYTVDKDRLIKYVDLINSQQPDIVVIDGDLVDYELYPLVKSGMQDELRKIKAPKGVYFIPGNHEYKLNSKATLDWISGSGMIVLKDSIVNIDEKLWLIGRDDASNKRNRKSMDDLLNGFDPFSKPCIMLAHQPVDAKEACEYGIPLTISGHTHGGQLFPANLVGSMLYTNMYGWKERNECSFYTTSGLGLSGFPLRSGSRCEIVIFNLSFIL